MGDHKTLILDESREHHLDQEADRGLIPVVIDIDPSVREFAGRNR